MKTRSVGIGSHTECMMVQTQSTEKARTPCYWVTAQATTIEGLGYITLHRLRAGDIGTVLLCGGIAKYSQSRRSRAFHFLGYSVDWTLFSD